MLTEEDIDHPFIHVDLCKLPNYSRDHLITWLKYCGDTLKHLDNMKEIRNRYVCTCMYAMFEKRVNNQCG